MRVCIAVFLALVVTGCSGQRPVAGPEGSWTSIAFDDVDSGTGEGIDAAPLLARYGISIANVPEGTRVVVRSEQSLYAGAAARAPSPPNVLTQVGKNEPVSFELVFADPVSRVQFRRAGLIAAGPSGITHPGWVARAFDLQGRELDAIGEDTLLRRFGRLDSMGCSVGRSAPACTSDGTLRVAWFPSSPLRRPSWGSRAAARYGCRRPMRRLPRAGPCRASWRPATGS